MAYTADRPAPAESSDELRARIPGWGVDLDPKDRPAVPRERFDPDLSGAHWDFPERQPEKWPRERSIEHEFLTPVFGTSCPPKGVSGMMRKYVYRAFSEGRVAHWLILVAADRVDALGSHLRSFLTLRPDNPVTETGVLSELSHHGISSRFANKRADLGPPAARPDHRRRPLGNGRWRRLRRPQRFGEGGGESPFAEGRVDGHRTDVSSSVGVGTSRAWEPSRWCGS